ncbi:MAG: C39 family peptidase [Treponema sp.]|nr:C39 family peptidase [Treponema sp.]
MKKRVLFKCLVVFFLGAVIFLLLFGRAIPSITRNDKEITSDSYRLNMNPNLFYRQTYNNCGPYSVMAVVNILTQKEKDPELLSKEMGWRISKNLTFPQGVLDQLHENGIKTKEYILSNKSNQEKIEWIKKTLAKGEPIICLIKIHHVLHYVTLLGYNEGGFMLYDSMQEKSYDDQRKTIVDEKCTAGNRYYTYEEFIELWNDGGYKIFFKNWAVVCRR